MLPRDESSASPAQATPATLKTDAPGVTGSIHRFGKEDLGARKTRARPVSEWGVIRPKRA